MTTYRKKLIEVALPLKAINEASAREKSIRHGHPSTLHLWWARRPLAACRAVLFASLVDDPDSDPAYRRPDGTVDVERAARKRAELFNLIEELVQWENSNKPRVINAARAEIARCVASRTIELGELTKDTIIFDTSPKRERGKSRVGQKHPKGPVSGEGITAWEVVLMKALPEVVNAFLAEHAPPVLDPFCGGGSIPLEAQQHPDFPTNVFYAFKQAESDESDEDDDGTPSGSLASTGWETMLEGLVASGFSILGTWPTRTELTGNLKKHMNVLASSVVLVGRPRGTEPPLATRKEFMNALRRELPEALKNLQHGNIAPVDLAQAAIGPGMAVFTRYAKVIESDGSPMTVRTALGIINQVLDEVLAEQEGEFDADTRWALAWFQEYGMTEGPFGVAETLSKAKNTAVKGLEEAGVVKARAGKVQLVSRTELSDGWDPATDRRLTVWETTQHLIRTLEIAGESEAAVMLNKLGGMAETARELAYRLYSVCERKKWAEEALAYNGLVIAWPELNKLARRKPTLEAKELF